MQEEFFMNSMEKDPKLSGEHGAQTRKSLALKAEEILGLDLETVVADDDLIARIKQREIVGKVDFKAGVPPEHQNIILSFFGAEVVDGNIPLEKNIVF